MPFVRTPILLAPAAALAVARNGRIQTPGQIQWQVPRGIQAFRAHDELCRRRLVVAGDVLFEFDKAALTAEAR